MLEGRLDEFALEDILVLLTSSRKTGLLCLELSDWVVEVDLFDGRISHVRAGGSAPCDALDVLLDVLCTRPAGAFRFLADACATPAVSDGDLWPTARRRAATWPGLITRTGGPDVVLSLAVPTGEDDVVVDVDRWRLLAQVDGSRTIAQLADRWGRGQLRAHEAVADLLDRGLLRVAAATASSTEDVAYDVPTTSVVADLLVADLLDADLLDADLLDADLLDADLLDPVLLDPEPHEADPFDPDGSDVLQIAGVGVLHFPPSGPRRLPTRVHQYRIGPCPVTGPDPRLGVSGS
ncbi:DUF4388 domain-containing protein [Egicoccus halophilus]|uniref:DUF4388 domain-containing protein n=1 Tax=Egicoccus halophilus TaxID=1670830 RepID=UPI001031B201|nr:DUF4388 domain-containing protein [Egicoccus halophilus]